MARRKGEIDMASAQAPARPTVPQLMTTVQQLSPAELRDFKRRFTEWQRHNGGQHEEETDLVQVCRARLPAAQERQLKRLIAKGERGELSTKELEDYRALVRRSERLDAARLAALTQLARRWNQPVRVVMETIGWEVGEDETTAHPPRPAKAGARSRR
jgi:hypothetical protein